MTLTILLKISIIAIILHFYICIPSLLISIAILKIRYLILSFSFLRVLLIGYLSFVLIFSIIPITSSTTRAAIITVVDLLLLQKFKKNYLIEQLALLPLHLHFHLILRLSRVTSCKHPVFK